MGRWLAYIRLFSFDIIHVPGTKHRGPDSLFRRPPTEEEEEERRRNGNREETEIEETIEGALGRLSIEEEEAEVENSIGEVMSAHRGSKEVDGEEQDETERIVTWLLTMGRPSGMTDMEFARFKREATKYLVRDGILYRRPGNSGGPPRKVISLLSDKQRILVNLHDESGHRERDATYTKVRNRFYWKRLYTDVDKFVQSCEKCQKRKPHRYDEPLHPTFSYSLWMKIGLDMVHMPTARDGCKYLVGMRDDLSGWAEYKSICKANSRTIAKFIYETWICRYGCPMLIVNDGRPENQVVTKQLLDRYQIRNIQIVPYHPQSHGLIERGHQNVVDSLVKMTSTSGSIGSWTDRLPGVMWADRVTVRRSTGKTPYRVAFDQDCLLPIDVEEGTWEVMDWRSIETSENPTAELLDVRARQLECGVEELEEAAEIQRKSHEENKAYFDSHRRRWPEKPHTGIELGEHVLLHDTRLEQSHCHKLHDRWIGPYRITDVSRKKERGTDQLAELDESVLEGYFPGDRLKKFMARVKLD